MNEKNLDYLKKVLDNLGFGNRLNDVLETAVRRELPRFTLGINNTLRPPEVKDQNGSKIDHIRFDLNFKKASGSDTYFLNNYQAALIKAGEPIQRIQTFDLERDNRITALQAYKLLSGFSFEKEIYLKSNREEAERPEKTKVWLKLNLDITDAYGNHPLRTFYPEYGYNLGESLAKYPLKDLKDMAKKEEALKLLRFGNLLESELLIGRKTVPVWIAANPQMKTIDIYDKNMREIRDEEIFPEKTVSQTMRTEASESPKNSRRAESFESQQTEQPWKQEPEQEINQRVRR